MHSKENRQKWGRKGALAKWANAPSLAERFWGNVDKNGPVIRVELGQCWIWKLGLAKTGYGKIKVNGKSTSAHRIAYELSKGMAPKGFHVCHHCDNKTCCRPAHLFCGTAKDNMRDAIKKGRIKPGWKGRQYRNLGGDTSPNRKLNQAQVDEIRRLKKTGQFKQAELGRMFGVGQDQISRIVNFKRWPILH